MCEMAHEAKNYSCPVGVVDIIGSTVKYTVHISVMSVQYVMWKSILADIFTIPGIFNIISITN